MFAIGTYSFKIMMVMIFLMISNRGRVLVLDRPLNRKVKPQLKEMSQSLSNKHGTRNWIHIQERQITRHHGIPHTVTGQSPTGTVGYHMKRNNS
jgi:hypothetical protein